VGWRDWLRGGAGEIGWDDLVRAVVDELAKRAHWGARGQVVMPPDVVVTITVPDASSAVVRGFVADPRFDREVGVALANRIDVAVDELPVREYAVADGEQRAIDIAEGAPRPWQLAIEGGDRDGTTVSLPPAPSDLCFGRGEWHGTEGQLRNDLVVCAQTEFVSRRAGRLFRTGHHLEVAALDQGDLLVVRRESGEAVRPARTARGRVPLRAGDVIELADGKGATVRLVVKR
jgi:hypothetical protein